MAKRTTSARKTQPVTKKKSVAKKAKTSAGSQTAKKKTPSAGRATSPNKKPTTRKTKTPAARKNPHSTHSAATSHGTAIVKMLAEPHGPNAALQTRRPPNNPSGDVPFATIQNINTMFNDLKTILDGYSAHLRALDRMRLNGVGIKKLGFIERAYELALENSEYLPHYLTLERFGTDIEYFIDFRSLTDLCDQIHEKLWNITLQSADIAYTDALDFYAPVREAAKRRVDAAETMYNDLSTFFKHKRTETEEPTAIKAKRDFDSLLHGKHDGKLIVENIKPKLQGGKRKIIDETFKDRAEFKGSVEGEIEE